MARFVAIRVDSSLDIGTGHAVRCQTLAKELRNRGLDCVFISRDLKGNMTDILRRDGFRVTLLPYHGVTVITESNTEQVPKHAEWLGTDWQTDAKETIAALSDHAPDWLVVDHYALDANWESRIRPYVKKIMVIDDLADRKHDCDLLLDQTFSKSMEERYKDLVSTQCARLLGPQHALLQPDYAKMRPCASPRMNNIKRILLFMGGVDKDNVTGLALTAFLTLRRGDITLDVVLSSQCPHAAAIREQAKDHSNVFVHGSLPSLAPLILKADLGIGAGGTSSWERCCLGLPALVVSIADNQRHSAAELDRRKLIRLLGHRDAVTLQAFSGALQEILEAPDIESWSRRCMDAVDGKGTDRVASLLTLGSGTPLCSRLA